MKGTKRGQSDSVCQNKIFMKYTKRLTEMMLKRVKGVYHWNTLLKIKT